MDWKDIRDNLDLIDFLKFKFLYLLNCQLNLIKCSDFAEAKSIVQGVKTEILPRTIKLLLILFASSSVFPSLLVFLVISLPARSTKLIFPCLVM